MSPDMSRDADERARHIGISNWALTSNAEQPNLPETLATFSFISMTSRDLTAHKCKYVAMLKLTE
jgi:hypothetical protein